MHCIVDLTISFFVGPLSKGVLLVGSTLFQSTLFQSTLLQSTLFIDFVIAFPVESAIIYASREEATAKHGASSLHSILQKL